jgi:23S rRNA (cytidine1920-2'-O)/16S rRNA (cytidine1409-2'-O)-methyltransferase
MVRRGLVSSRESARREIEAGRVLVNGSFAAKPATMVDPAQAVTLTGPPPQFVGRGAQKLEGALDEFGIDPAGLRCLDAGSSTGGFTDSLLQRGAASVVAVDVGTNQLHEKLRNDHRVDVREQTDVRSLNPDNIGGPVDLIVGDLSFISLRKVLPGLIPLAADGASLVLLVKPQFEAGRQEASKGKGIITDPDIWRRVLGEVVECAVDQGAGLAGITPSPITGSAGNVEFVAWLIRGGPNMPGSEQALDAVVANASALRSEQGAVAAEQNREPAVNRSGKKSRQGQDD